MIIKLSVHSDGSGLQNRGGGGVGWHGYSLRQDYHNRATRSHKKTIEVKFQNHKRNYFLRSFPDPKYRFYANLCNIVSVVVVVALDLLNNDNNNHIKITDGLFYELFDFSRPTSKWIIFSQKYVFYDHYTFLLRKKVNKKTTRQAYYYESYFHNNLHKSAIQELLCKIFIL